MWESLSRLAFPYEWRDRIYAAIRGQGKCEIHGQFPSRIIGECFQCGQKKYLAMQREQKLKDAAEMVAIVQYAIRSMKDDKDS